MVQKRRGLGQQWHHMQTIWICTLLHTDNHTNTSSLNFKRDAPPDAQPIVYKHWRQTRFATKMSFCNIKQFKQWNNVRNIFGNRYFNTMFIQDVTKVNRKILPLTDFRFRLRIKRCVDAFDPTWQAFGTIPQCIQDGIELSGSVAVEQGPRCWLTVAVRLRVINAAHVACNRRQFIHREPTQ